MRKEGLVDVTLAGHIESKKKTENNPHMDLV